MATKHPHRVDRVAPPTSSTSAATAEAGRTHEPRPRPAADVEHARERRSRLHRRAAPRQCPGPTSTPRSTSTSPADVEHQRRRPRPRRRSRSDITAAPVFDAAPRAPRAPAPAASTSTSHRPITADRRRSRRLRPDRPINIASGSPTAPAKTSPRIPIAAPSLPPGPLQRDRAARRPSPPAAETAPAPTSSTPHATSSHVVHFEDQPAREAEQHRPGDPMKAWSCSTAPSRRVVWAAPPRPRRIDSSPSSARGDFLRDDRYGQLSHGGQRG